MGYQKSVFPIISEIEDELRHEFQSTRVTRVIHSARIAALIVLVMFIALIFALIFLPWVQTVSGYGKLIAYSPNDRQQNLESPVEGQIVRWSVMEGQTVKKGDEIVEISDIDPNFLQRVTLERDAARAKLLAAGKSLESSRKNLKRQAELFRQGLSSRRAFELAEIEEAKFAGEVASASAELARVETRLARQASQRVQAPRDGVIQRILAPSGGVFVKQGTLLAVIVPETDQRAVEILIDGNDLPIVSIGRPVRIQFEGWPAVQFSGWPSMAVGTFGGKVAVIDPSDNGYGKFRILVVPDEANDWPDGRYLRQGARAVAWVTLDTVRLGWELWRRFNAFPILPPQTSEASDEKTLGVIHKVGSGK
jgi:multidrug efflux pump subunit AcrA (membrane-fusion protein)